jgi:dienelactone hydrolase
MGLQKIGMLILIVAVAGCSSAPPPAGLLGAYRLADSRNVSIRRSADATLRYRIFEDGDTGRLYPAGDNVFVSGPGFSASEPAELTVRFMTDETGTARELSWAPVAAPTQTARRVGTEYPVWIESDGTRLYGRLHLPESEPPFAAVVMVHGSGDSAASEWFYNGDFFVANGVAMLAFDKRGSGKSSGDFTFDFEQLADDVVAAVEVLAARPEIDADRIGLSGYSQGAWVAPLAAARDDRIGFVLVSYGMIESPAEEARLEMRQLLIDAGVSAGDMADADELIRASVDVVASGLESHWDRFEELKRKHRDADWLRHLDGTPIDKLVTYPSWLVKLIGKRQLPAGLRWHYDSRELLLNSEVPMAWLLAGKDRSAPNKGTIEILEDLIERGKPYSLTVFPDADHGMLTVIREGDDVTYTGYVPEYFRREVMELKRLSRSGAGGGQ